MNNNEQNVKEKYLNMCKLTMDQIYGFPEENKEIKDYRYNIFHSNLANKIKSPDIFKSIEFMWLIQFTTLFLEFKEGNPHNTGMFLATIDRTKWNTAKHKNGNIYLEKIGGTYNKSEMLLITNFVNENILDIENQWKIKEKEIRDNSYCLIV